jgi:hypothetical protein
MISPLTNASSLFDSAALRRLFLELAIVPVQNHRNADRAIDRERGSG